MAGLSSIRGRGPGGPLAESIRESPELRATISPQTIYSYDEKRADYIERPGYGRGKWESLAVALGGLNPELKRMLAINNQRWSEEETAMGRELMHRNKMAWNDFIKANPDYAGLNPHLERGYKSADLESKAQDYQAALLDFYITGGLANETDPEKVRTALDTFGKDYIAGNIRRDDFDPDLYNEHFLSPAQAAEGAILGRHSQDRKTEHLNRALDKYSQLFASTIDSMLDGTANISNPDVFGGVMDNLSSHATVLMQEMEMNGVPRSIANAAVEDAILNLAQAEGEDGHGHEILALADKITTGTGTIGGRPEFKAKVAQLEKQWENQRRADASEARQIYLFNQQVAHKNAIRTVGEALVDAYNSSQPLPDLNALMALPGVGLDHIDAVVDAQNQFRRAATHDPLMDAAAEVEFAQDFNAARTGQLSLDDVMSRAGKYSQQDWLKLYSATSASLGGEDIISQTLKSPDVLKADEVLANLITQVEGDNLIAGMSSRGEQAALDMIVAKAKSDLHDELEVFCLEKPRSSAEIRLFLKEKTQDIFEKASTASLQDGETPQEGAQQPQHPNHPGQPQSPQPPAQASHPYENHKYYDSEDQALDLTRAFIRGELDPKTVAIQFGIPPEEMTHFIGAQAKLFNLNVETLLREYENERTRLQQQ